MERFLKARRALVVGGSGGIGAGISISLARLGANVCVHGGHDTTRLNETAAAIRNEGALAETLLLDITTPRAAEELLRFGGDVDVLVVAFGPWLERVIVDTVPEEWERMIGLNLTLPALLVTGVLPHMVETGYGRILLFGGPRSDRPGGYREIAAYGAAKHGLAGLVRSVALQHASHGIRCNMVCPGYVDTHYLSPETRQRAISRSPGKRLVTVNEMAAFATGLLHPSSDAVNGAVIPADFGV